MRETLKKLKPYVPGKNMDELKRELGLDSIIKLASNENSLGPSPKAVEAMRDNLNEVNIYPDSFNFYLKKELTKKYDVKENQIIVGNGSDEILKLISETYLEAGDEIIMPNPSFSEYEFVAIIMGAEVIKVDCKDFEIDVEGIEKAITDKTKIIFIANPNNPTGTYVNEEKMTKLLNNVSKDILIVLDEAYFEYATSPDYPDGLDFVKKYENVITLRTFSKIHGLAGLRIGFGISTEKIISEIHKVREPFNVNSLAQVAALASLQDPQHVENSRKLVIEEKEFIYSKLKELGLGYVPTEANFLLVDVKYDSKDIFQALLKKGIIVRSGDIFGLDNYIRLTIGTREENIKFFEAIEQVLEEKSAGN